MVRGLGFRAGGESVQRGELKAWEVERGRKGMALKRQGGERKDAQQRKAHDL